MTPPPPAPAAPPPPRGGQALAFALGVACTLLAGRLWQAGPAASRPLERTPSVAAPAFAAVGPADDPVPRNPAVGGVTVSRKIDAAAGGLVHLNHASAAELQQLPGIGPKLAQRIVDARARQPFAAVDDLRRVGGIGAKTLDRLRPLVTVEPPRPG